MKTLITIVEGAKRAEFIKSSSNMAAFFWGRIITKRLHSKSTYYRIFLEYEKNEFEISVYTRSVVAIGYWKAVSES